MAEITAAEAEEKVNLMAEQPRKMKVMIAVNMSNVPEYQTYVTSRSSKQAFDWIVDMIKRSNSSAIFKLFLVYVQVPFRSIRRNRIPCFGSVSAYEWPEGYKEQGERFLVKLRIICNQATTESELILKRGVPEQKICEAVREVKPDLLIIGNRGLGAFRRLYVKSVSEYVAKHAECPVIRIKRREEMNLYYSDDPAED